MRSHVMSLAVSTISIFSTASFAQTAPTDVAVEKRASALDVLTNTYTKVEARHGLDLSMEGNKLKNSTPRVEVRPTVGTRLVDGRLDLNVTFGAIKKSGTAEFTQRNPEIVAELSAYSGDNLSVTPYLDVFTPFAGKGTSGKMAVNTAVKTQELSTGAGTISLTASVEPGVETASRPGFAPVDIRVDRSADELGLVYNEEKSTHETEKREPNLSNEAVATITFKPSNLAGVTASLGGFVDTEWSPKYEVVVSEEESFDVRKAGYNVINTSFNRLRLTWAVNDRVLFINDTLQYIDGIYEKRVDGKRWENVARLSYTLF